MSKAVQIARYFTPYLSCKFLIKRDKIRVGHRDRHDACRFSSTKAAYFKAVILSEYGINNARVLGMNIDACVRDSTMHMFTVIAKRAAAAVAVAAARGKHVGSSRQKNNTLSVAFLHGPNQCRPSFLRFDLQNVWHHERHESNMQEQLNEYCTRRTASFASVFAPK
jgi:hypothetical protein